MINKQKCPHCDEITDVKSEFCEICCEKLLDIEVNFKQNKKSSLKIMFILFFSVLLIGYLVVFITKSYKKNGYNDVTDNSSYEENYEKLSPLTYKMDEIVNIGYFEYQIKEFIDNNWMKNRYIGQDTNTKQIIIKIKVKNNDYQSRDIPPFYLVDENGAQYKQSSEANSLPLMWYFMGITYINSNQSLPNSLNPGVKETGNIAFDVPTTSHQYRLIVSDGKDSGEEALIQLEKKEEKLPITNTSDKSVDSTKDISSKNQNQVNNFNQASENNDDNIQNTDQDIEKAENEVLN